MNQFERAAHLRTSDLESSGVIDCLVFVDDQVVVGAGEACGLLHRRSLESFRSERTVFLGQRREIPVVSIILTEQEIVDFGFDSSKDKRMSFRDAASLLGPDEFALLAYAEGLRHWHSRSGFCSRCGEKTSVESRGHVRLCTSDRCGMTWFPRLDPVVIMRIVRDGRLLLGRHRRKRSAAFFSTIAGFVEPGETLEQAVAREILEEVGLKTRTIRYLGSQPWPLPSSLMIAFEAEAEDEAVHVDETELIEAIWFTRDEIRSGKVPLPYGYSIAWKMIQGWVEGEDLLGAGFNHS